MSASVMTRYPSAASKGKLLNRLPPGIQDGPAIPSAPPQAPTAELEAEIKRLEEELERKRLEEEIRRLESQLEAAEAQEEVIVEEYDSENEEYIVIEEIVDDTETGEECEEEIEVEEYSEEEYTEIEEEYTEVVEEEEVVEETVEDAPTQRQWPPPPPPPKKEAKPSWVKPQAPEPEPAPTPTPVAAAPAEPPKPRKKWVPMSQRDPKKYHQTPPPVVKSVKTGNVVVPFKQRQFPNLPPSPEGQETPMEKILGSHLLKNSKMAKVSTLAALKDMSLTLLYFGASWRTECKRFMPLLSDFYKRTAKTTNLECIYISVDRTLFEFKDCYNKMPYVAMPTGTTAIKNKLSKQLKINDLPALVVMETATAKVITTKGVRDLEEGMGELREKKEADAIVDKWKKCKAIDVGKVKGDKKNTNKGAVYWHD